ncbi:MAG: FKBP-type peptidyl-prolyl cis-trans isomerase [Sphingomonadales bacterium]
MSEVTAVPIAPTKRSWLVWLAVGVVLAAIVAIGTAWSGTAKPVQAASFCKASDFKGHGAVQRLASGVAVQTVKSGTGARPGAQDFVLIGYKGMLRDGTVFDSAPRAPLQLSEVVPGFSQGLQTMQPGGSYRLCIPPELGYGDRAGGPIPPNSTLFFDIELIEFKTVAEVQRMQQQMQAMQQQMPQGQGAPAPR